MGTKAKWRALCRIIGVALVVSFLLAPWPPQVAASQSWWDSNWQYRNVLAFNATNISENLTNFAVRVYLTSSNFDFSLAKASGEDVRFIDKDDTTELTYEIEWWDQTSEGAVVWVKIPTIDSNSDYSDYFYIYYGNEAASDNQDAEKVWGDYSTINLAESLDGWTGTSLSLDSASPQEGTYSIKDTVASPTADTSYITTYNPSGTWDLSEEGLNIDFWLKSDRASTAFTSARLYLYDGSGNYRYHDLTFSADTWANSVKLAAGGTASGTPPTMSTIDKLTIEFVAADTTAFAKNIDWIEARWGAVGVWHFGGAWADSTRYGNDGSWGYAVGDVLVSYCDYTTDWTGTSLSIDSTDKQEGFGALKDTIASPTVDTSYDTVYNPSGTWNLGGRQLRFWWKSDRASTAYTATEVLIYDGANTQTTDIGAYSADTWVEKGIAIDTGLLDEATITSITFRTTAADTTSFYKLIDMVEANGAPNWSSWSSAGVEEVLALDSATELFVDSSENVWLGTWNSKIYKSSDDGSTWTLKYTFDGDVTAVICLFEDSEGNLYSSAQAKNILIRSTDGGENWSTCLTLSSAVSSVWQMAEDADGNLYAGEYTSGDGTEKYANVWKSTDNGDTWNIVYNDPDARHIHSVVYDTYTGTLYVSSGEQTPSDLVKSTDGGATWATLASGTDVSKATVILPADGYRLLGTDSATGEIYKTTDDTNFTKVYDPSAPYDKINYYWGIHRESDGMILFGAQVEANAEGRATLVGSWDKGATWKVLFEEADYPDSATWGFRSGAVNQDDGLVYFDTRGSILGTSVAQYRSDFDRVYGLYFDGFNDWVNLGTSESLDVDSTKQYTWLFETKTARGTSVTLNLMQYPGYKPRMSERVNAIDWYDGAGVNSQPARTLNDNEFHHLGYTLDNTSLTLHIDGETLNTASTSTFTGDSPDLANLAGSNVSFEGIISEVTIYNRTLSGEEVEAHDMSMRNTLLYFGGLNPEPIVTTLPVTDVAIEGGTAATLRGRLDDMGNSPYGTDVWFEWGYSPALGATTATQTVGGTGYYSFDLAGFDTGETVYYRFAGEGESGVAYGGTLNFLPVVGGGHGASYWMLNVLLPIVVAATILIAMLFLTGNPIVALVAAVVGLAGFYIVLAYITFPLE